MFIPSMSILMSILCCLQSYKFTFSSLNSNFYNYRARQVVKEECKKLSFSTKMLLREKEKISEGKLRLNDSLKEAIVKANRLHYNSCENELRSKQRQVYMLIIVNLKELTTILKLPSYAYRLKYLSFCCSSGRRQRTRNTQIRPGARKK